ncbi:MAG: M20/M25/M40 family metallo-hydrolase [Candidatus Acidiferrales bacterium]
MEHFELTRALVDIESITGHEGPVGDYLFAHLSSMAAAHDGRCERMEVEPGRFNVFGHWGEPRVTLSTHMDTVPPTFVSREDDEFVHGRGSCDAKGIIAAMISAAQSLLAAGTRGFGVLFVVGEERNSAGALAAARNPRGSRYLINGEPTDNRLVLGSKGALRFEIVAHGRMAHSAYPELGHSAIHSLLDALEQVRRIPLPKDRLLGATTLNIGTISGGRAPNVVADYAQAEILFRIVGDPEPLRIAVAETVRGRAEVREVICIPAVRLEAIEGFETSVVSFATDIPAFGGSWGTPCLIGPGSIHVAHTDEERVPKKELSEAVGLYERLVKRLLANGAGRG